MRKYCLLSITILLLLGMSGNASAIPYQHTYDAGGTYMRSHLFSPDDSVSWTFDITNDGFNPDTQDVTSASVLLNLADDGGFELWEFASLNVGTNIFRWEVDSGDIAFSMSSLMTLSDTGMVSAKLTATWGDFFFNSATLFAEGTDADVTAPAPVPEPASMLLLGTGMVGLAGASRKKIFKKS